MTRQRTDAVPTLVITALADHGRVLDELQLRGHAFSDGSAPHGALAVRFDALVVEAMVHHATSHVSVVGGDDHYSASIPLVKAKAGGMLYLGVDESLPRSVGGPFRLVVQDGRTRCWNVKNVRELRFTTGAEPDSVPTQPAH